MIKKAWSFLLLCVIAAAFFLMVALCFDTVQALDSIISVPEERLPGESILGPVIGTLAVWGGFLFYGFITASVGLFASIFNIKIASGCVIKRISTVFAFVNSAILLFIIGLFGYFLITLVL